MDRMTERDEFGNADIIVLSDIMPVLYDGLSFSETNALTDALNRLAACEDTGLTPAEVVILKARSEKESFIDHLNMLCDMKDKQISELFHENQRLKKIISDIADIIRKEKD